MTSAWDRRSLVEQARVEELALADWLPGAVTFSPHWQDVIESLGLRADELVTRDDLLRVPPSTQADVSAVGGTRLVQRPTESQVKAVASASLLLRIARSISGDQREGKRELLLQEFKPVHVTRAGVADELAIASSRADIDRQHRVGARAAQLLGLGDHDYLVSAVPAGPTAEFWSVHALAMGSSMLALHPRGHEQGLEHCVDAFGLMPTTAAACAPQDAISWARQLQRQDADVSRVVTVVLVGPPVDDSHRAAIAEAWRSAGALEPDLAVRSIWAPDVHRGVWAECKQGTTGLHTMPDLELLELLDPVSGAPTDRLGDLTLTSLGWSGTTLLRYRTGVEVESLVTTECPACHRTVPRLVGAIAPGRWQPELQRRAGIATLDLRTVAVELDAAGLSAWRVELFRKGEQDSYALELGGSLGEDDARRIAARLRRATGIAPGAVRLKADASAISGVVAVEGTPFADAR